MASKKISKNLVVNLIDSLKVMDLRLFKPKLSKLDLYTLSTSSFMDSYQILGEDSKNLILKRTGDFVINYINPSNANPMSIKCFNNNSFFIIDKEDAKISLVLTDVRMIIERAFDHNICKVDNELIDSLQLAMRRINYNLHRIKA